MNCTHDFYDHVMLKCALVYVAQSFHKLWVIYGSKSVKTSPIMLSERLRNVLQQFQKGHMTTLRMVLKTSGQGVQDAPQQTSNKTVLKGNSHPQEGGSVVSAHWDSFPTWLTSLTAGNTFHEMLAGCRVRHWQKQNEMLACSRVRR